MRSARWSFRHFLPVDLLGLDLQDSQRFELGVETALGIELGEAHAEAGPCWTLVDLADGRILACGGFHESFARVQATMWLLVARDLPHGGRLALARFGRRLLEAAPYRRVEAVVDQANRRAMLFAAYIGLEPAHALRNFGAASTLHMLFERIN